MLARHWILSPHKPKSLISLLKTPINHAPSWDLPTMQASHPYPWSEALVQTSTSLQIGSGESTMKTTRGEIATAIQALRSSGWGPPSLSPVTHISYQHLLSITLKFRPWLHRSRHHVVGRLLSTCKPIWTTSLIWRSESNREEPTPRHLTVAAPMAISLPYSSTCTDPKQHAISRAAPEL